MRDVPNQLHARIFHKFRVVHKLTHPSRLGRFAIHQTFRRPRRREHAALLHRSNLRREVTDRLPCAQRHEGTYTLDVIDAELRLLVVIRTGGQPSTAAVDELLDERLSAHPDPYGSDSEC